MNPLTSVQNPALEALSKASQSGLAQPNKGDEGFGKQLMDVLKEVNDAQTNASEKQTDLMTGRRNIDYHDLMIAMEKASVAMQLTMSVRNKLLDAYQEVSHTQV
jgi:flagellar hook-basal body complex protein FliE